MDIKQFEKVISKSESTIIDFKKKQYNVKTGEKTADFIKDIISFSNTIRNESAFIIIGIENLDDDTNICQGIDQHIDDSIFQQKIKDKVNPKPIFSYSVLKYKGKDYGVFEIPIKSYSEPISPIINMKGLEKGKVYFRRGSSNSEATIQEIISINDWLRSLKQSEIKNNTQNKLSRILNSINNDETSLASIVVELLEIAKEKKKDKLVSFFESELKGLKKSNFDNISIDEFNYRKLKVIISTIEIKSLTAYRQISPVELYNEVLNMEGSYELDAIYNKSVNKLDSEYLHMKQQGPDNLFYEKRKLGKLLEINDCEGEIMQYYLYEDFYNLIQNIKLKYKNEILKLLS